MNRYSGGIALIPEKWFVRNKSYTVSFDSLLFPISNFKEELFHFFANNENYPTLNEAKEAFVRQIFTRLQAQAPDGSTAP